MYDGCEDRRQCQPYLRECDIMECLPRLLIDRQCSQQPVKSKTHLPLQVIEALLLSLQYLTRLYCLQTSHRLVLSRHLSALVLSYCLLDSSPPSIPSLHTSLNFPHVAYLSTHRSSYIHTPTLHLSIILHFVVTLSRGPILPTKLTLRRTSLRDSCLSVNRRYFLAAA